MSIGKSFLARVLTESTSTGDDLDSIKKRISDVKKSAGGEMFNITDVIVEVGNMFGIPARIMKANIQELKTNIRGAADRIKLAPTEATNLTTLHQALLAADTAKGGAETEVAESNDDNSFHGKVLSVLKSLGFTDAVLEDEAAKAKIAAAVIGFAKAGGVKRVINRMASFVTNEAMAAPEVGETLSNNQFVNDAVQIMKALGLDVFDTNLVRTGKNMAIQKSILAALKMNPMLKPAMRAFLTKVK